MGIGVLGPLTVEGNGAALANRDRIVLAALAISPGGVVSADRLADALWGDDPPASATKVVQGCVVRLRKAIGADAIETTGHGYRLNLPSDEVDAQRFERLLRRGRELVVLGEPERAVYAIDEGLALWRGPAFVDLDGWVDGRAAATRLDQLRCDAEDLRLDAALRAGLYREVLSELQLRVDEEPLRERRWALLALALYQAGRQADALRVLDRARRVLVDEAGLDPGFDLRALEQAILDQDPALAAVVAPHEISSSCPYLGLVPYDVADADAYFGRAPDVARCLDVLRATGVVAVVGPSGIGKSSLVRAGIAATLRGEGRQVTILTPGTRPMTSIDAAPSTGRGVLVVDQCEEVVTVCSDHDERTRFLDAVAAWSANGTVVVALRADRLGEVTDHAGFARLVERGLVLIGPPGEPDVRSIIISPAEQAGLLIEPGLVELLVRDVEGEPGALPLLSHALRATWERREGRVMTVAGYQASGGIRGAVAQSAEALYEQASGAERGIIHDLMLRLVVASVDDEPVLTRVPRPMIASDAEREDVLERLVAARLVTCGDGGVELAHLALAKAWPRLRSWLDEDVDGQRVRLHLSAAAAAWDAMGRPDGELYRGARLDHVIEWRRASRPDLSAVEQEFLDVGSTAADAERRATEERTRQQVRVNRRLRGLLGGLAVLLVAALIAGTLAVREAGRADTEADRAAGEASRADAEASLARQEAARADAAADGARREAQRADAAAGDARREAARADAAVVSADARRVGAQALAAADVDRALLLAVEGVRLEDSPDTRASLLAVLQRNPALVGIHRTGNAPPLTLDVSPDGGTIAVGTEYEHVGFFDATTWKQLGSYGDVPPAAVAFSPDGATLAVARESTTPGEPELIWDPQPLRLVDVPAGTADVRRPGGIPDQALWPRSPVFSPDGRTLAAGFDGAVGVWDVAAPASPRLWIPVADADPSVALTADGTLAYVGTASSITVHDTATGAQIGANSMAGTELTISPDGTILAVADGDDVVLVDAATLTERMRMGGHTDDVEDLRFSHDGSALASSAADHTTAVWNVADGERVHQFGGHAGEVVGVAFSPDDDTLYTAGLDHLVLTWDLTGEQRFLRRRHVSAPIRDHFGWILPSPGGAAAAFVNSSSGTLRFLDTTSGRATPPIDARHGGWGAVAWSPDARRLVTSGSDGVVRVWDAMSGELEHQRQVADGHIGGIGYTADASALMIAERQGVISTIDAETLRPTGPRIDIGGRPVFAFTSPAGSRAIVFTYSADVIIVDLDAGAIVVRRRTDLGSNYGEYSPDGRLFAATGRDGRVQLLDGRTGAPLTDQVAHADQAMYAAYSPDGSTFLSSGFDGRVNLWNGSNGAPVASVLPAGPDASVSAEYTPDGDAAVIVSGDGAVFEWDLDAGAWIDAACAIAGRTLDPQEWRETFPGREYRPACGP